MKMSAAELQAEALVERIRREVQSRKGQGPVVSLSSEKSETRRWPKPLRPMFRELQARVIRWGEALRALQIRR